MSATMHAEAPQETRALAHGIGLPGRIAVTWTAAGGLLLGGFLVAGMTLAGRLSGNALLLTSGGLFVVGAVLGYLHGAALGYFGRPDGMSRRRTLGALGLAAVYAIPVSAIGLVVAGWIAMTMVTRYIDRALPMAAAGLAWTVGAVGVVTAAAYGWRGLRNAYARWPERRLGTLLTAASFGALLVLFQADRPEIWGLRLRVTEVGAVLLALFATLWVAGPAITFALRAASRLDAPWNPLRDETPVHVAASVAIGIAAGALVGLLALPFYGPPAMVPVAGQDGGTMQSVVTGLSQALVNEVLLRLVLVTGAAWMLLKVFRVNQARAAVGAVLVGVAAQVLLYLPAVAGIGFASPLLAAGYVMAGVVAPAAAFGTVYWLRGLPAALLADATAVVVLALLVA